MLKGDTTQDAGKAGLSASSMCKGVGREHRSAALGLSRGR
jgi:hypothetical protein